MALKQKARPSGVAKKHPSKPLSSSSGKSSSSKSKKSGPKPTPTQHKPKPASSALQKKRKPPHARYTEADLKLAPLNGIRPAGVQKLPNKKKGKQFVDDSSMRTILAMVMAEKEGNIESKMMRVRQLEELREARRAEAEKRAEGKQEMLEERKAQLKNKKRKSRQNGNLQSDDADLQESSPKASKRSKRVSFG